MEIIARDLRHLWHPCSQMKDYETFSPLQIVGASGSTIETADGRKIIDAISSWWCKSLGHGHPRLKAALKQQLEQFEHVMLANLTHEPVVALSEKLAQLTSHLSRVFYASDGSCAVEIAMKMALQAQQLRGNSQRKHFMSLKNGYHGETSLALAASDSGLYRQHYEALLLPIEFIDHLPYVNAVDDATWNDCSDSWPIIEAQLLKRKDELCAILVEPIVQGAGNMKIYSADFLRRLAQFAAQHDIYLIADEIMTGIGRTGYALACEHAQVKPDFVCLSKGLTSGMLPLSAVLTSDAIYELFYDDYSTYKGFLHSHTYCGNALGVAVANETLAVMDDEKIYERVRRDEHHLAEAMHAIADETGLLRNVRHIGFIAAADLVDETPRLGYQIFQHAIAHGALLRSIGNTIYWLPPLNTSLSTLRELAEITRAAIVACST